MKLEKISKYKKILFASVSKFFSKRQFMIKKYSQDAFSIFRSETSMRQIEIINSIWKSKSITDTAKELRMSPANVSRACSRFEKHFDFPIFHKKRKGIVFTEFGEEVLKTISKFYEDIEIFYEKFYKFF